MLSSTSFGVHVGLLREGLSGFARPVSHRAAGKARARHRCKGASAPCSPRSAARRSIVTRASLSERPQSSQGRRELLQFVQDAQPVQMEQFVEQAPPAVVSAMRTTITNMLGTLPPAFFTVTVSTVGENLAQLMYSVMLTGYAFRNAQYRMELRSSLGIPASSSTLADASSSNSSSTLLRGLSSSSSSSSASSLPAAVALGERAAAAAPAPALVLAGGPMTDDEESAYAPGVQKSKVSGEVLMWHKENGLETMGAVAYMELLEQENARLRQQLSRAASAPAAALPPPQAAAAPAAPSALKTAPAAVAGSHASGLALRGEEPPNEVLDFLRSLPAASVAELTACASAEVTQAMDAFVQRLMGTSDQDMLRRAQSECTAQELGRLMFWLMVVGYTLRGMEVRLDMEGALGPREPGDAPAAGGTLPPARP